MPSLRKLVGAQVHEKGFRRAYLVPIRLRLALSLWRLRLALLGFPPLLSGVRPLVCL